MGPGSAERRCTPHRVRDRERRTLDRLARTRAAKPDPTIGRASFDALSTLLLSILFLLSVFLVVQFFLSQEVTGKDKALEESTPRSRS